MTKPTINKTIIFSNVEANYEMDLYALYFSEKPIDTLIKFSWDKKEFDKKIELFTKKYKDDASELVKYFTALYDEYYNKYKLKKEVKKGSSIINKTPISVKKKALELVKYLAENQLSINEYASENLYCDIKDVHAALKLVYFERESYVNAKNNINSFEKKEFGYKMSYILDQVRNNPDFNIINYYLNTGLSLSDFKLVVGTDPAVTNFMSRYQTCKYTINYENPVLFRTKKLNERYIYNGVEMTQEQKEEIFEFMETNNIPYTSQTYPLVRKMYLENTLKSKKVKTI